MLNSRQSTFEQFLEVADSHDFGSVTWETQEDYEQAVELGLDAEVWPETSQELSSSASGRWLSKRAHYLFGANDPGINPTFKVLHE